MLPARHDRRPTLRRSCAASPFAICRPTSSSRAQRCLLDLIGVAAAGSRTPAAAIADAYAATQLCGYDRDARILFDGRRAGLAGAAFAGAVDDRCARRARRASAHQGSRRRGDPSCASRGDRRCAKRRAGRRHRWSRVPHVSRARLRDRDARGDRAARDGVRLPLLGRVERARLRRDRRAAPRSRRGNDPRGARRRRVLRSARPDPARVRLAVDGQRRHGLGRARRRQRGAACARRLHRRAGAHGRAGRRARLLERSRHALADSRAVFQGVPRLPLGAAGGRGRARVATRAPLRGGRGRGAHGRELSRSDRARCRVRDARRPPRTRNTSLRLSDRRGARLRRHRRARGDARPGSPIRASSGCNGR